MAIINNVPTKKASKGKLRQYFNEAILQGFTEAKALDVAQRQIADEDRAKRAELYLERSRNLTGRKQHGKRPSSHETD